MCQPVPDLCCFPGRHGAPLLSPRKGRDPASITSITQRDPNSITLSMRINKDHNPIVMAIPMQQTRGNFPKLLYLYLTHLKQKEADQLLPVFPMSQANHIASSDKLLDGCQ